MRAADTDSAYIYVGGLPYDVTEGDVITIFSQFGEVVNIHLPRPRDDAPRDDRARRRPHDDDDTERKPKHRGFGFLMYEDQRSTILAVDNLNGAQVLGRTLRVDHVLNYKPERVPDADGNLVEPDEQTFNCAPPETIVDGMWTWLTQTTPPPTTTRSTCRIRWPRTWPKKRSASATSATSTTAGARSVAATSGGASAETTSGIASAATTSGIARAAARRTASGTSGTSASAASGTGAQSAVRRPCARRRPSAVRALRAKIPPPLLPPAIAPCARTRTAT